MVTAFAGWFAWRDRCRKYGHDEFVERRVREAKSITNQPTAQSIRGGGGGGGGGIISSSQVANTLCGYAMVRFFFARRVCVYARRM